VELSFIAALPSRCAFLPHQQFVRSLPRVRPTHLTHVNAGAASRSACEGAQGGRNFAVGERAVNPDAAAPQLASIQSRSVILREQVLDERVAETASDTFAEGVEADAGAARRAHEPVN